MKKIAVILGALFFLGLIGAGAVIGNPFKVTDPADPRFNLEKFKLGDYRDREELGHAFTILFPIGMSRKEVEKTLMKSGVVEVSALKLGSGSHTHWEVRYTEHPNPFRQLKEAAAHIFIYDSDENLINILPFLGDKVYQGMPAYQYIGDGRYE